MTRYTVNGSILLTDLPILERPAAIKAAGFEAAEFWWPFPEADPSQQEVDDFVDAVSDAGIALTGLNFFAGDMPAGDRGLVSWKSRQAELAANIGVVVAIGERLDCRAFNALYGLRNDECTVDEADELALDNLTAAAEAVKAIGGTVLLEPVSGSDTYPLKTATDVLAVIDKLADRGVDNVKLLADFYHLAVNGDDVDAVIAKHTQDFGHIQIADVPGRGEPGSGDAPISRWIADAETAGYTGWIGLEYKSDAADPFAWLPRDQRSA